MPPPQHCCPSGCWRPSGLQGSDPCPCSTHSRPWQGAGCVCWALRRHYGARMRGFGAPSFPAGGCWRLCHPEPVPLLRVPRLWQLRACWGRVHLVGASGTPMEVPWLRATRWSDGQMDRRTSH